MTSNFYLQCLAFIALVLLIAASIDVACCAQPPKPVRFAWHGVRGVLTVLLKALWQVPFIIAMFALLAGFICVAMVVCTLYAVLALLCTPVKLVIWLRRSYTKFPS